MGFLSFLTRKSSGDRSATPTIKTQAYESTVASNPPVRGTYPVAGNGPNVLDKLQQAARKRSLAQIPVIRHDPVNNDCAPSPLISRFPETIVEAIEGRPNSAPDGPRLISRSKSIRSVSRSSRCASPQVSLRPDNDFIQKQLLPTAPSGPLRHRRRGSSLDSGQLGRFVDILDAQGELKPSNFRSRVKASGARDYGEDVAERNIGENGHDLHSAAVRAFYLSSHSDQRAMDKATTPTMTKQSPAHESQSSRLRHHGQRDVGMSLTKMSDVSAWKPFSETDEPEPVRRDHSRGRTTRRTPEKQRESRYPSNALCIDQASLLEDRRRSFHAFGSPRSRERSKPRPLSLHPSVSNFNDEDLLPPLPGSRPTTSGAGSTIQGFGKVEVDSFADESFNEPAPSPNIPGRSRTIRHMPSTRSELQSDRPVQSKHSRADYSLSPSRPSSSSSVDPSRPRTRSIGSLSFNQMNRLDDITEHIPVRTSSLGLQSQPCFTPTTMSSGHSSNPFPRPQSQHTAATSVDASLAAPSEKLGPDYDFDIGNFGISNTTGGYHNPVYYTAEEEDEEEFSVDIPTARRNRIEDEIDPDSQRTLPATDSATLGHYVAGFTDDSDVDSFVGAPGRASSGGEEGLTFDEGIYNGTGGGLPGLFDSFPRQALTSSFSQPNVSKSRAVSSPKLTVRKRQDQPRARPSSSNRRPQSNRRHESHGLAFNEQDFASFLAMEHELLRTVSLMRASDLSVENKRARRSMYSYADEDEAKVDMRTAMRLRKDLRRMDTVSSGRSRRSRSTYRRQVRDDDEGNAADTED